MAKCVGMTWGHNLGAKSACAFFAPNFYFRDMGEEGDSISVCVKKSRVSGSIAHLWLEKQKGKHAIAGCLLSGSSYLVTPMSCHPLLPSICWHSMSSRFCHISDSNLLTISDNTNSVHNLLPFCNQKLLTAPLTLLQICLRRFCYQGNYL